MKKWKKRYNSLIDTVTKVLQAQLELKTRNDYLERQVKQALSDYRVSYETIEKEREANMKISVQLKDADKYIDELNVKLANTEKEALVISESCTHLLQAKMNIEDKLKLSELSNKALLAKLNKYKKKK